MYGSWSTRHLVPTCSQDIAARTVYCKEMWLGLPLVLFLTFFHHSNEFAAEGNLVWREPNNSNSFLSNSPQFVVKLPDENLLCFSFEGYELFTYNLITSNYIVLNGFLNLTSFWSAEDSSFKTKRGFSDIGVLIKAVDKRVRGGKRYFKHLIYEKKKKAILEGFGDMDMNKGAITFTLNNGHSDIESQECPHEEFRVIMDKPQCNVRAVSIDGQTFNVYSEDSFGLMAIDVHGLIGQFYHNRVYIDSQNKRLHLARGKVVPVREDVVWDTVVDKPYGGKNCWYPNDGESPIEGQPWEYIVEDIMSVSYKYSLFKK